MDDYTIKSSTTSVSSSVNKLNQAVVVDKTVTEVFSKKLTCTAGMSLIKKIDVLDIFATVCTTNADVKVASYMIKRHGQQGYVTNGSGKPASINEIVAHLELSRQAVSTSIAKLLTSTLIVKHKRAIYVNPYLNLPYGNSASTNHILQLMWDDKYEHTYDEVATVESIHVEETTTEYQ